MSIRDRLDRLQAKALEDEERRDARSARRNVRARIVRLRRVDFPVDKLTGEKRVKIGRVLRTFQAQSFGAIVETAVFEAQAIAAQGGFSVEGEGLAVDGLRKRRRRLFAVHRLANGKLRVTRFRREGDLEQIVEPIEVAER